MTNLYRIETVFSGLGTSDYFQVSYFSAAGANTPQAARDAMDTFWAHFSLNMVDEMDIAGALDVPIIDDVTGDIVDYASVLSDITQPAVSADDVLPLQTQSYVNWRTNGVRRSRRVQGRTFIPGLTEGINDPQGNPLLAFRNAVNDWALELISDPDSELRIWSRPIPAGTGEPGAAGTSNIVTNGQCAPTWGALRSRR